MKLPDGRNSEKENTGFSLPEGSASGKSSALRICIVEDDGRMRAILSKWLESIESFTCVGSFGDGASAVESLPGCHPHIVLMDINLPDISGVECVRRLKGIMPETQFVMLTVYEDSEHIFNALEAGAVGYLLKRSSHEEIKQALLDVHAGGSPMTSLIARKVVQAFCKPQSPELEQLSSREREVLDLMAQGFYCKEIADTLQIRLNTVYTYIRRIYEKLQVRSRMEAVKKLPVLLQGDKARKKPKTAD
jgi:DNA-binding NarL/FixJ family response regulator